MDIVCIYKFTHTCIIFLFIFFFWGGGGGWGDRQQIRPFGTKYEGCRTTLPFGLSIIY